MEGGLLLAGMGLPELEERRRILNDALRVIAAADNGVVVLLHRTETGADLLDRLNMADDTPAQKVDLRTYGIGAQILRDLGVSHMRVLSAPLQMQGLSAFGLDVVEYVGDTQ